MVTETSHSIARRSSLQTKCWFRTHCIVICRGYGFAGLCAR